DSFMKLDIAEDDYKSQKAFIDRICDFKNEYKCHVHMVVHPRKPSDEFQPPGKLDYKGTGSISDLADNCFTVWRNKMKEQVLRKQNTGSILTGKEEEKLKESDCLWICDKNRIGDYEGTFYLWFDQKSFQYLANPNHRPIPFV